MSDHKTMKEPSLWVPERDLETLAAIGKLGEEAAELCKICFRISIQGLYGHDPETGKLNPDALAEEIADVKGLSELCMKKFILDPQFIEERADRKKQHKVKWIGMIQDMLVAWRGYERSTLGTATFEQWLEIYRRKFNRGGDNG